MASRGFRMAAVSSLAILLVAGCRDEPTRPPFREDDLREALTASLAASLGSDGRFMFGPDAQGAGEIGERRARELAVAYWRSYESTLRIARARDRGAPISAHLTTCSRAFYVESAYESLPSAIPREFRRAFGAQWIVGLCSGQEQQVAISVSAEAMDLQIRGDGKLAGVSGGDFFSVGVAPGANLPALPELGAVTTSKLVGRRVATAPVLRRPGSFFSAFYSKWVYGLEAETTVRGVTSGELRSVDRLAFGPATDMRFPQVMASNPAFDAADRIEQLRFFDPNNTLRQFPLTRRADVPAQWEIVRRGQP